MNFDRLTALMVRVGAMVRAVLPWPYALVSALRAAWWPNGYFARVGMLRSMATGRAVDTAGAPLPLLTYPVIDLLSERLSPTMRVFEYGCGGSTRFFASRVGQVVSVEHLAEWVAEIAPLLPDSAEILHRSLDDVAGYTDAIDEVGGSFDVILVDGRHRARCIERAIGAVSDRGVIVVDDTDRQKYSDAMHPALAAGFRRLDLSGLRPGGVRRSTTTLLYRPENCLGI